MVDLPSLKQKAISNISNIDIMNENESNQNYFNFSYTKDSQNNIIKELKDDTNSKVLDFPLKRKNDKLKIDNGHHKRHSTLMEKSFNNPIICLDNTLDKSFSSSLKKNLSPINKPEDDYYNKFSHLYSDINYASSSKSPVKSSKSLIKISDENIGIVEKNDNKFMKRFPTMISKSKPIIDERNNQTNMNNFKQNNIVSNTTLDNYNSENCNSGYLDKSFNNLGYSENSNSQIMCNETKQLTSDVGKIQNNIIDIKSQLNTYEKVYDSMNKHLDDQNLNKIKSLNNHIDNLKRRINEEEENNRHLKESHLKEIEYKEEFSRKELKKQEGFYLDKIKSLEDLNQLNLNKITEGYEIVSKFLYYRKLNN